MLGNNVKCTKVKRVLVPLSTQSAQGRFQLPDDPDLDRKNIVGISASYSSNTIGDISAITPYYEGNLLIRIPNTGDGGAKRAFLTLYNDKNELMIESFPLIGLFNRSSATVNRIVPITGKIKSRQSYISLSGRLTPPIFGTLPTIYLNFFYI
jgi:hypothetical protein